MIFISHNHQDKAVVEVIAIRLAQIFGKENVFYDSWAMQPGDGIIDRMNDGLEKCTHFFYFVSQNSINSNMVKLEWQNAIHKASKGNCKVIPVRMDATSMPAILSQSLYIDLYSNGLEAAIGQIVNVIQGNSTFNASSNIFSNLTYKIESATETEIILKIYASHFLEPIPNFIILFHNNERELNFSLPSEGAFFGGFNKDIKLTSGDTFNGQLIKIQRGITPSMPLKISIKKNPDIVFMFAGVLHHSAEDRYTHIPGQRL